MGIKHKGIGFGLLLAFAIITISYNLVGYGAGSCGPGIGFLISIAIFFGSIILSLFFIRNPSAVIKITAQTFLSTMLISFVILLVYLKLH